MHNDYYYICSTCESDEVRHNADVAWDVERQEWSIVDVFDSTTCEQCGGECKAKIRFVIAA